MNGDTTLGDLSYTYDAAANRTATGGSLAQTVLPSAMAAAVVDPANHLTQWNGSALTYDKSGNLTSDGLNTYVWNARNQLVSIAGAVTATFAYDPFGRRTRRTVGGVTTRYLYDGVNAVQELDDTSPTANLLTGLGVDETFVRTDASGSVGLLTDALGSVIALTDASGAIATRYAYGPFGQVAASGAVSGNAIQFAGRENDGTGLYYNRARYYSPQLGRFVSEDPLGLAAGDANVYAYVRNTPTMFSDPLGLEKQNPVLTAGSSDQHEATPWYEDRCIMGALADGAVHVSIDAIGLVPEGGFLSRAIGNAYGYRGIVADQFGNQALAVFNMGSGIITTGIEADNTSRLGELATGVGVAQIVSTLASGAPVIGQGLAFVALLVDLSRAGVEISRCN